MNIYTYGSGIFVNVVVLFSMLGVDLPTRQILDNNFFLL